MGMGVVRGERETGRKDLVVTEREPMGMGGEESMAGLGLISVVIGLGWARPRWRWEMKNVFCQEGSISVKA